ncbi:hypothetical protein OQH60_07875 [Campylobacter sp. MIT 21-1685]|uniref:hypothetical protein n=1 Tax=unclassified Campylobacter TaxID=2593542 RepID=UPI00224AB4C8|nr:MULTISPECIES: hypothetical protein [unclassified Campylobacter]MCX2683788.1 hypothetical protein [Campylobacter sp. MIT 21-1684]MCX2752072.1 hypothetical protein [Campylobacter sp. MIT 21-1682]MCX2808255.1 hypothetical protein [Campylobacter sp. MIT 21-1685]
MTHTHKYSLGIYVNRNFTSNGGSGMPHVFLGLKKEKVKCNEVQIQIKQEMYEYFFKYNMQEKANECKKELDTMQCFINDTTLEDLRQELSKYNYTLTSHKNFKTWSDTDLNDNKDFDKVLRETFNKDFTFLRQCYGDITEPFFIWVKNIKNIDDSYLQTKMNFDEFEKLFGEFIQSSYSNTDSIEGFFGFGPYESGLFNNYEENKHITGGKVFQNNHWNDDFRKDIGKNTKTQDKYDEIQREFKNKPLPRIPLNTDDKQYLIYSKDFTLTTLRPLKTFQERQSEVMSISESQYKEICKSILFQTLLTSDKIRGNSKVFGDTRNTFKDYKVVGNSCVDFVMDKLQLIGASEFDKITTLVPYDVIVHIQNMIFNRHNNRKGTYKKPLSQGDRISLLLYDVELYYQNYSTLCSMDSTWGCEEGLKAFNQYCEFLLQSNLLNDTRLNRLTNHTTNNQLKSLARNAEIEAKEDDVNMHLNTHFCIASYFQDRLKYMPNLQTEVALILYDEEKKQYLKADSQSQFAFSEFSYDRNTPSHNIALWYEQPILFEKNPYPLAIQIQENIFNDYPKYFAQSIVGEQKDYGDYRDFLKQERISNA